MRLKLIPPTILTLEKLSPMLAGSFSGERYILLEMFIGKLLLSVGWLTICAQSMMFGQTTQDPQRVASETSSTDTHTFDIVSIKPNKSGGFNYWRFTPDGWLTTNEDLQTIIVFAYDLHDPNLRVMTHEKAASGGQIETIPGGPKWINRGDRYDIQARMSDLDVEELKKLSPAQQTERRREMVRAMLVDRFKLKVHHESRVVPCFALIAAKDGPKNMKKVPDDEEMTWEWPGRNSLKAKATSMAQLSEIVLTPRVECPVSDKTGLIGKYDFNLEWAPDLMRTSETDAVGAPLPDASGPSIFTAVQKQLGLKLQPTKIAIESITIDHIERPSGN